MEEILENSDAVPAQPAEPITIADNDAPAYDAVQRGAALFELTERHISVFTGDKATEALNGLVSNDLASLAVGSGVYAAALTPKGKMLADVSILRTEPNTFMVDTSAVAGAEWATMVRKYVNPRLAKYRDATSEFRVLALFGPSAPVLLARLAVAAFGDQAVTQAMEDALRGWVNWAHATLVLSGETVRVVRAPLLGPTPGFVILTSPSNYEAVVASFRRVGAVSGSAAVWEMCQLESGRPAVGLDMDANTIPQEANLDEWQAISYQKGCYTGQETVARLHFRGHVNKQLRGVVADALLDIGAAVHDAQGKAVGTIRRSGRSPRMGPIAIAMIRREVTDGAAVTVMNANGAQLATVRSLPFVHSGD